MKNINIEYGIDELVYFMYQNKVVSGKVKEIRIDKQNMVYYDILTKDTSYVKEVKVLSNTLQGLFEKLEIDFKK